MKELIAKHTERACELVYEALTGKCWHKPNSIDFCDKCGERAINPDLANSLDAWRPLWERMDARQRANHSIMLHRIKTGSMYVWDSKPIHHLEAALRAIEVECEMCGGRGYGTADCCTIPDRATRADCLKCKDCAPCIDCKSSTGKITLWDKLEGVVKS